MERLPNLLLELFQLSLQRAGEYLTTLYFIFFFIIFFLNIKFPNQLWHSKTM